MSFYRYSNTNVDFSNSYINEEIVNFAHRLDSKGIEFSLEIATEMGIALFKYTDEKENFTKKVFLINGYREHREYVCFPTAIMNKLFPLNCGNRDNYGNSLFAKIGKFVFVSGYGFFKVNEKKLFPCKTDYRTNTMYQYEIAPLEEYCDSENVSRYNKVRDIIKNELVYTCDIVTTTVDGKYFPISEIPSNIKLCGYSGYYYHKKNMEKIDNEWIAKKYISSATVTCSNCGEKHLNANMVNINGRKYCKKCVKNMDIVYCSHCRRIIADKKNAIKTNKGYVCDSCISRIDGYHESHRNERIFRKRKNDNSLFIGFENEFDFMYSDDDEIDENNSDKVYRFVEDVRKMNDKLFNLERDGSLDIGVEVISEVFSENYIRSNPYIPKLFKLAEEYGFEKNPNCGLHFHLNKRQLTASTIENIVVLFTLHFEKLGRIAERENFTYCHKPLPFGKEALKNRKGRLFDTMRDNSSHGVALNYENRNTIEIRLFNGVVTYKDFMDSFETMIHIVNYAKTHTFEECIDSTIEGIFENAIPRVKARIAKTLN